MKHWALGWACNLNHIFIQFPYTKYKSLMTKWKTPQERKKVIKDVFRESLRLVVNDIIDNNITFEIQGISYYKGEIHMEAVQSDDFVKARKNGKYLDVDYLESLFTGYQMFLYIKGKHDNFLHSRKYPIYLNKFYKDKITKNTNEGKTYC